MNYYERHIGDYLKDTAHLSLLEHGVYGRLLDVYYTREGAIDDTAEAMRLISARTPAEKAAVKAVLAEFFDAGGIPTMWRHKRCDTEIARYQDKRGKAKASADARWAQSVRNANASADGMRTHSERNADGMPHAGAGGRAPSPHTPDTSHQTPEESNTHVPAPSTDAGRVCLALKRTGIGGLNPGHPDLLALIAAGATEAEFIGAGQAAVDRGKGFAYAIGMLKRQRLEAAQTAIAMHTGPMPTAPPRQSATDRQIATMNALTGKDRHHERREDSPAAETIDVTARVVT